MVIVFISMGSTSSAVWRFFRRSSARACQGIRLVRAVYSGRFLSIREHRSVPSGETDFEYVSNIPANIAS